MFPAAAYSSKTHTMLGKFPMDKLSKDAVTGYMSILESDAGIMPRAIHHIFQGLQRQVSERVSLEQNNWIYLAFPSKVRWLHCQDHLSGAVQWRINGFTCRHDQWSARKNQNLWRQRQSKDRCEWVNREDRFYVLLKNNTIVGAIEAAVETPFEAFKVLVKGSQRRQTAETLMNASSRWYLLSNAHTFNWNYNDTIISYFISSSRSHSIFTMTVTMKDAQGDMRFGKLHLVCCYHVPDLLLSNVWCHRLRLI